MSDKPNTKMIDYIVQPTYNGAEIKIVNLSVPTPKAQLTLTLIERWGMVACELDGEDTAGRQKLRLMTPEELVERACATATLAFDELARRDWMMSLPKPDPEDDQFMDELNETRARMKQLRKDAKKAAEEEGGASATEAA